MAARRRDSRGTSSPPFFQTDAPFGEGRVRESCRRPPSLLRTVLNLTGCVLGVAGSICYEVTAYWAKMAFSSVLGRNYECQAWRRRLDQAASYEEWNEAAEQLDRMQGNEQWKEDPVSDDYDYELIQMRLEQFRVARERKDLDAISFLLRASMSRGFGDIGNLALYSRSYTGTKKLIAEFNEEIIGLLELMYRELPEGGRLDMRTKSEFFRSLRHMVGNTALLLSGGASLGTHHVGVLKALHETRLLPRIISGSSSGSIMAAVLCTRTDEELPRLLDLQGINMNFLEEPSARDDASWKHWRKLKRMIREGVVFDQNVLRACMRENVGDVTFLEAFRLTRRVLNVTVSSSTHHEMPRMLNYLTAPNVLVWSAVVASCAVPGVYSSSPLQAKDPQTGALVPWHLGEVKWIDGSVEGDVPRQRLGELFNVNHFIVSQVNPHVYPFLKRKRQSPGPPRRWEQFMRAALFLVHSEACFRLRQLASLNVCPQLLHRILSVLTQKYDGDITVVPDLTVTDFRLLFADPSVEQVRSSIRRGETATWPLISIIWNQCKVELVLDQILSRLRQPTSPNSSIGEQSQHFRRSSSPLVYRTLEASMSLDDFVPTDSDSL